MTLGCLLWMKYGISVWGQRSHFFPKPTRKQMQHKVSSLPALFSFFCQFACRPCLPINMQHFPGKPKKKKKEKNKKGTVNLTLCPGCFFLFFFYKKYSHKWSHRLIFNFRIIMNYLTCKLIIVIDSMLISWLNGLLEELYKHCAVAVLMLIIISHFH